MDVEEWKAELAANPGKLESEASKVVKKGALEIKKAAQRSAKGAGGAHAKSAWLAIQFDMTTQDEAEIGYNKRGQGKLGNLLEYGSVNNPPHDDLGQALESEGPTVEKFLVKALAKSWR